MQLISTLNKTICTDCGYGRHEICRSRDLNTFYCTCGCFNKEPQKHIDETILDLIVEDDQC